MGLHQINNRRRHLENLILSKATTSLNRQDQAATDGESASAPKKKKDK